MAGKQRSVETREKISRSLTGKKLSPEAIEKIAATKRGVKQSPEHIAKRVAKMVGHEVKEETRALISQAQKRSWGTDERVSAASQRLLGKRVDGTDAAGSFVTDQGYRVLTGQQGHPLVDKNGSVGEHRAVLYAKIGPDPHPCYWGCGKTVYWFSPYRLTVLCADHVDSDRLNNDPENLVPSCFKCNWDRGKLS